MASSKTHHSDRKRPLPYEIADLICICVEQDQQALKTLRLVCKPFPDVALNYIFKTIYLNMDPNSWGKLNKIADHSVFKNKVQRILCETGLLPPRMDDEHWKKEVLRSQEVYDDPNAEQLRYHWKKFESLRKAEQSLLGLLNDPYRGSPELELQLSKLENLHSIETVYGMPGDLSTKEQDTLLSPYKWLRDNSHLTLLLQSIERNKVHLPSLKLVHFPSSLPHYPSSLHITDFHGAIRHLRHLDLNFGAVFYPDEVWIAQDDRHRFTHWLGLATQLETFKLKQQQDKYNAALSLIRGLNKSGLTWPKLNTVHFTSTLDDIDDITDFLSRHEDSIRRVHVVGAGRQGRSGPCWVGAIAEFPELLDLHEFTFRDHLFGNLLPAELARSISREVDPTTYYEMQSAMNAELGYIGRHGHSSSNYKRIRVLGAYFPEFIRDDTNRDSIKIAHWTF